MSLTLDTVLLGNSPAFQQILTSRASPRQEETTTPTVTFARSVDRVSRYLDGSLGLINPSTSPVVDKASMRASFVLTTPSKDRYGDSVVPRGCERYLPTGYAKNPRVFFGHKSHELPIGSCRRPDGSLAIAIFDDKVVGDCYFHGKTPESTCVFALVAEKELEACSIGFRPLTVSLMEPDEDEVKKRPAKTQSGEEIGYLGDYGLRFLEWDLLEWSICGVGANSDCLQLHLDRGHVHGEKIPDSLRSALLAQLLPSNEVRVSVPSVINDPIELPTGVEVRAGEPAEAADAFFLAASPMESSAESTNDVVLRESLPEIPADPKPDHPDDLSKTDSWPLGAKFLTACLECNDESYLHASSLVGQLEQPRVKKYAAKRMARLLKETCRIKVLAHAVYPDLFPECDSGELAADEDGGPEETQIEAPVSKSADPFPSFTSQQIDEESRKAEQEAHARALAEQEFLAQQLAAKEEYERQSILQLEKSVNSLSNTVEALAQIVFRATGRKVRTH